jgi:hypothetical protein
MWGGVMRRYHYAGYREGVSVPCFLDGDVESPSRSRAVLVVLFVELFGHAPNINSVWKNFSYAEDHSGNSLELIQINQRGADQALEVA